MGWRSRTALATPLPAVLAGSAGGLVTLAASAVLARSAPRGLASLTAEAILLSTLVTVATLVILARPARLRRARVPIGLPVPRAWWPDDHDVVPILAVCAGTPMLAGAEAAFLLFR